MLDQLLELLKTWGYVIVFLGALVEGESVILAACIAAYFGYMSLPKIMITAFIATLFADQALYYVGRFHGNKILEKYPKLKIPAHRAFTLLHRWDLWFILVFRFIYGIRTVSPIIIGTAHVAPSRFIPLNFIAAVIWTVVSCLAGYSLGPVIELIDFAIIKKYMLWFSLGLLALLGIIIAIAWRATHPDHPDHPNNKGKTNDPHHPGS